MKLRKQVKADMQGHIGQTIVLPFTREEIDARSDLEIKDGVFTLNGYDAKANYSILDYEREGGDGQQSKGHMNIVAGSSAIGGNPMMARKIGQPIFMILVKVVENKPNLA